MFVADGIPLLLQRPAVTEPEAFVPDKHRGGAALRSGAGSLRARGNGRWKDQTTMDSKTFPGEHPAGRTARCFELGYCQRARRCMDACCCTSHGRSHHVDQY